MDCCSNGGYCMHDEAATHYVDMIDQTTLGHRYIKQQFDVTPRIGWQIDPFGHSAVQAYLLGAEVKRQKLSYTTLSSTLIPFDHTQICANFSIFEALKGFEFCFQAAKSCCHTLHMIPKFYKRNQANLSSLGLKM